MNLVERKKKKNKILLITNRSEIQSQFQGCFLRSSNEIYILIQTFGQKIFFEKKKETKSQAFLQFLIVPLVLKIKSSCRPVVQYPRVKRLKSRLSIKIKSCHKITTELSCSSNESISHHWTLINLKGNPKKCFIRENCGFSCMFSQYWAQCLEHYR